jgi:hypothetical protein
MYSEERSMKKFYLAALLLYMRSINAIPARDKIAECKELAIPIRIANLQSSLPDRYRPLLKMLK